MALKIMTDSACDLPQEIKDKYELEVVPILVYDEAKEFLDGETLTAKQLLEEMRLGKVYKTSQIPPHVFKERFTRHAEAGNACLYIAFSSGLSGTYESAMMAREEVLEDYPQFQLEIIDTKCASLGFGLVVLQALKMQAKDKTMEEIMKVVEFEAVHMQHLVTVDNLEYLYRGGRVSRASAVLGGLLNIKPIIEVKEGKLIPMEKSRGRNKVIKRMIELMGERGVNLAHQTIGIAHGDDLQNAMKLKEIITETYGCQDFVMNDIGCAIGAHAGPGTLTLHFLDAQR